MQNSFGSAPYSKLDLRRLWPVVSATLYPEAEQRVRNTLDDLRTVHANAETESECQTLVEAVEKLSSLLEIHNREVADVIKNRLNAFPYGNQKFPADYFESACERHSLSSAGIKTEWNNIRVLARRCFGKTRSTATEKLALARLNGVEQDVLYILFVERQYICPLILRPLE